MVREMFKLGRKYFTFESGGSLGAISYLQELNVDS